MEAGTKVIGYVRVSTAEQAAGGHGLDAQESAIRHEVERRGWVLVRIARDEGASGKDTDRPGLLEALRDVRDGAASGLVVGKLDRLSRSVVDFGTILDHFNEWGATLVALDLGVDTSTPTGRLVANVLASVAEWERETIGQRTKDGLAVAKAKGRQVGGPSVPSDVRERIATMRADGLTLRAIADSLNDAGVPTARGGTTWRASTVNSALGYKTPTKRRKALAL